MVVRKSTQLQVSTGDEEMEEPYAVTAEAAARAGDLAALKKAVAKAATVLESPNDGGDADSSTLDEALISACQHEDETASLNCVKLLLSSRANPCAPSAVHGANALWTAVRESSSMVVEALLEGGARTLVRHRLAIAAAERGDRGVMSVLLQNGIDVDERVVAAAVKNDNAHLLPLLVSVQWYRLSRSGNLHAQALLSSLDWEDRYGVCDILLQNVAEKETGPFIRAFVQSFRKQPFAAFSDIVFLCTRFIGAGNALALTDPFKSDHMLVQATRCESIVCGLLSVLESSDREKLDAFLQTETCLGVIREAVHGNCKVLVNFPTVQRSIRDRFICGRNAKDGAKAEGAPPFWAYLFAPLIWVAIELYPPLLKLVLFDVPLKMLFPTPRYRYWVHGAPAGGVDHASCP